MINKSERLILNKIRSIPITRNRPTPTEMVSVRIQLRFGMSGARSATCDARICRSGSEIVTKIPIKKLIKAINHIFPDLPRYAPILVPSVCIDISAPIVKRERPNIRQMTPKIKSKKMPGSIGVSVMARIATITAMGKMEWKDSKSLDLMRLPKRFVSFLFF